MIVALFGAYTVAGVFHDITTTLVFTVLGLAMVKFGFNRPALLLGFVLGGLFEKYLLLAYKIGGPLFFMRPICIGVIIVIIAGFCYGPIKERVQRSRRGNTL